MLFLGAILLLASALFFVSRWGLHYRRGLRAWPLGVPQEEALAMSLIVQASNLLSVACVGAFALWLQGVALTDLRMGAEGAADAHYG